MNKLFDILSLSAKMIWYNIKIIFGNKFVYFLLAAIALFLLILGINLFNGTIISKDDIYQILILTGALLLFYPTAYGIQSDKDSRTLEIIFGIPNYRYRVWFMRLILIFAISFFILLTLTVLIDYALVSLNVFQMVVQVLFPLAFLGFLSFFLSTVLRTGNGTAAVVIILGILMMILGENFDNSFWNVFFNPFDNDLGASGYITSSKFIKNRIFLTTGGIVFLLGGLMRLQQREKFL